jgi:hypothetical protein
MRVKLGNRSFVPMEMRVAAPQLGQPAESSRVDLTLGEDTDGDGLPDAWERAMIQSGRLAMSLAQFSPTNRINGNALTVMESYVAGTYAWDPKDGFRLDIQSMDPAGPVLRFMGLRGRSYTISGSDDLKAWVPLRFTVRGLANASEVGFFQPTAMQEVRVVVRRRGDEALPRFFRLAVQ